ncbi:hypothetical protein [Xenorhabdus hominickii]
MPDELHHGWIDCHCGASGSHSPFWYDNANEAEAAAIQAWNQRANDDE